MVRTMFPLVPGDSKNVDGPCGKSRRCLGLGLFDFDMNLQRMNQILFQVFWQDGFFGDFAQRYDGVLVVVPIKRDWRSGGNSPRPVGGQEYKLEAIWNLIDAIFDGDASHVNIV
jgi:hypothetical protein